MCTGRFLSNRVGGPRGDAIIKVKNESGRALSGQLTYTPSPAGADIPVNRGQLTWLIWGAKGAPEPENQPAFTDVSEPEMAKAAQWCVEQGILTAPGETTFRPNGWVTRVKVIQTWNTAFPKQ